MGAAEPGGLAPASFQIHCVGSKPFALGHRFIDGWVTPCISTVMAYVVTDPCVKCKYTDCVEVCPVDCFYEGVNFLAIHPDECIDCGACEPVCPTQAIFVQDEVPEKWKEYVEINARYCKEWPEISEKKDAMPDAEKWKAAENKRKDFDPRPFS